MSHGFLYLILSHVSAKSCILFTLGKYEKNVKRNSEEKEKNLLSEVSSKQLKDKINFVQLMLRALNVVDPIPFCVCLPGCIQTTIINTLTFSEKSRRCWEQECRGVG